MYNTHPLYYHSRQAVYLPNSDTATQHLALAVRQTTTRRLESMRGDKVQTTE